jgi:glutaminase
LANPRLSPVERYLRELHEGFQTLDEGTVADYIPELGKADPRWFGLCIATVDGHVYEVGDARQPFTIQSISKPFVYGLALEDRGKAAVLERVGMEPTGDAFNEISLAPGSGRPLNPMINAGAITSTSLVVGHSQEDRWNRILALFSMYAGRGLELNEAVYQSERGTGHRNRAIGHMLRNFDILQDDPEPELDLYFRQCSIELTCRDLSVMAATLATGGLNPVTRERALDPNNVDEVLSVMTTCGMYDYAGEWVYRIGLPAKSGVAGGILAVLPGQLGIGIFSPPLDPRGNSVRGVAVCEALSEDKELHFLRAPRASLSTVRSRFDLRRIRSKRVRGDRERAILADHGQKAVVYQLQGDLSFAGMEIAARKIVEEPEEITHFVLDITRVNDVDVPAARLMLELLQKASDEGDTLVFVGLGRHPRMLRLFEEARTPEEQLILVRFEEFDLALEWCEDRLLAAAGAQPGSTEQLPLEKHQFLEGFDAVETEALLKHLERREIETRRFAVRKGETADALFLLVAGSLSVLVDTTGGDLRRLSTLSPGMGFGEHFLVEHATRTAFVRADCPSTCWVLSRSDFRRLADASPKVAIKLLQNLIRSSSGIMERLSAEAVGDAI